MRRSEEHPAARGFAAWLDRRGFEHEAPEVDGAQSIAALWALWLAEHACGVAGDAPLDEMYAERLGLAGAVAGCRR